MHKWLKPLAAVSVAALMVLGVVPGASATYLSFTDSAGIMYNVDSSNSSIGAAVSGYSGSSTAVSIPATVTIDGVVYDVTGIWGLSYHNLTSVTIPNSVTSIGYHAFEGNALTSVTIPGSVTSIGEYAFYYNHQLTSVTISGGVTSIGVGAFSTGALTSVTIPNSVTSIGDDAFSSNILTSVTIPGSVTSIGDDAFAGNQLLSVTISDGVTRIGAYSFSSNGLASVTIPGSVTSIGDDAFVANGLRSVRFLGAAPLMGSAALGSAAFGDPADLVVSYLPKYDSSVFPGGFTSPTWTPDNYTTFALATVTFDTTGGSTAPAPVTVKPDGTAPRPANPTWTDHTFAGWFTAATGGTEWDFASPTSTDTTLYAHWISGTVTSIDNGITYTADSGNIAAGATVSGYSGPSTVAIPATVTIEGVEYNVTSIGAEAFRSKNLSGVTIPNSVTSIGDDAFSSNILTSVTIPGSVASIGDWAFKNNRLMSVSIPDSVTSIGQGSFGTNSLTSVALGNSVTSIGDHAFEQNSLTSMTIPASVTSIGSLAFGSNYALASVRFLGAAPVMGFEALHDGMLFWNVVVSYLPEYDSSVVGNGGFTSPNWTPAGTPDAYRSYALATVTFDTTGGSTAPAPVTVNSDGTTTRPADPTWTGHTFTGWFTAATGGTAFDFTSRVTTDTTLYAQWTGPVSFTSSDGVTYSADSSDVAAGATLDGYTGTATTFSIPSTVTIDGIVYNVTSIGDRAFSGPGLTSVTIPDSVTSIGNAAFEFSGLTSLVIGNSVTHIGTDAFAYSGLTSVTIPDSVTYIGDWAFEDNSLTSVTIPDGVTYIGDWAFADNDGLTSVKFSGAAPTFAGMDAFGIYYDTLTVFYRAQYGAPDAENGFTSMWDGYKTQALADVTYDTTGGSTAPAPVTINSGDTVNEPTEPTWAGHTFDGWFTAATGGTAWDFGDAVTADTTLYAQWTALAQVTFDTTGGSTTPAPVTINSGDTVNEPTEPTWAGHTFDGWFTAATGGTAWDFGDAVTADTTLYAQWTTLATVSFDTAGGSTAPKSVTLNSGSPVDEPTAPTWAGHVFNGWFTAATGGTAWDFTSPVAADISLYAQWAVTVPPVVVPPVVVPPVLFPPVVTPAGTVPPKVALSVDLAVGSPFGDAPVNVKGSGLLANSPWTLVLHSTPTIVASGIVGSDGTVAGTFSLPVSIPAGTHTLTLAGTAPDGSAVTSVVYLTVSSTGELSYLSSAGPESTLAATGVNTPTDGLAGGALLLILFGAALIFARRRRTAR
ncbi:leucine-rich repeat protein [Parafrigoribacterium mesophilum]|uniref:leucine-rich repeat protein n=1 Tax=Parafrigoribacterium mesophilum TaxID=433646 RepID=UPI0031FE20FC